MTWCKGQVAECIDDMCRNSAEEGLCGKPVDDIQSAEEFEDDGEEWYDFPLEPWTGT